MSTLNIGREMIDKADTSLINLAARFTYADLALIEQDFNAFIHDKKLIKASIAERFEGVANVAWSKLATLTPDAVSHATSYREERHLAVLQDRVKRTVALGGDDKISHAFFDALLKHSVQEQDKYLQRGDGDVCDAMEYLFK